MSRRQALVAGAGGVTLSFLAPAGSALAQDRDAHVDLALYPTKRIGRLSELVEGEPFAFTYPLARQPNMLVKLGEAAQHGIGPERDVVAFSVLCSHRGGSLRGRYRHDLKALGLSEAERAALLAFLDSLSGEEIIVEPPQLPKYEVLKFPMVEQW